MKNWFLLSLILTFSSSYGVAETSLKKVSMAICTAEQKKCLTLKSEIAKSSFLKPIITFNQHQIEILVDNKIKTVEGDFGYIDFSNKIIVTRKKVNNVSTEKILSLATLNINEF